MPELMFSGGKIIGKIYSIEETEELPKPLIPQKHEKGRWVYEEYDETDSDSE